MLCNYNENATFYKVTSDGYGNNKILEESTDIPGIFIQGTGFLHSNNQDAIDADVVFYIDHENDFVINNWNRLEGMFMNCSPFGAPEHISWFRVNGVNISRDHLLTNTIDNVELLLKKSAAPKIVS